jgi:hypothetical protein
VRVSSSDNWTGGFAVVACVSDVEVSMGMIGTDQVGAGSDRKAVPIHIAA